MNVVNLGNLEGKVGRLSGARKQEQEDSDLITWPLR